MFIMIIIILNSYFKAWHLQKKKTEKIRIFQQAHGHFVAISQIIPIIGIISERETADRHKQFVENHTAGKKLP